MCLPVCVYVYLSVTNTLLIYFFSQYLLTCVYMFTTYLSSLSALSALLFCVCLSLCVYVCVFVCIYLLLPYPSCSSLFRSFSVLCRQCFVLSLSQLSQPFFQPGSSPHPVLRFSPPVLTST